MVAPPSMRIRISLLFIILSEHSLGLMLPTYLAYMMENFIKEDLPDFELRLKVSYYSGTLEGCNQLMTCIGCLVWGSVSDRIGRKYCLIIVLSGLFTSSIGFGLSSTFQLALFFRMLSGFFAGSITVAKAMLRDFSDDSTIGILYSYFGTSYGLGSIFGPLIGGLLSRPYRLSSLFSSAFFYEYPYFLPQLCHCIIVLTALTMVITIIPHKPPKGSRPSTRSLIKNWNYLKSVWAFCLVAFVQFSYRILMALWVKSDTELNGLGWNTEVKPGYMNAASGVFVAGFSLYCTSWLSGRFGIIKASQILLIGMVPAVVLVSWTFAIGGIEQWVALILCNSVIVGFNIVLISYISIAISNSVNTNIAGAAIGIGQSLSALTRSIATGTTAMVFGANQQWEMPFPFDSHFCFLMIVVVLMVNLFFLTFVLGNSVERRTTAEEKKVEIKYEENLTENNNSLDKIELKVV